MKLIIHIDDAIETWDALACVARVLDVGKISTQQEPRYCFHAVFSSPPLEGGELHVSARSVKGQKSIRLDVTVE